MTIATPPALARPAVAPPAVAGCEVPGGAANDGEENEDGPSFDAMPEMDAIIASNLRSASTFA